jgi:prephenate dehydratase
MFLGSFLKFQALGQCRSFIAKNLPGTTVMKTASTAVAAKILLTEPPDCAAICSIVCAELYEGLEVLFTGIQDTNSKNFRRRGDVD